MYRQDTSQGIVTQAGLPVMDGYHGNSSSGMEPGRIVCLETAWTNKNGLDSLKGIHIKRREVAFFCLDFIFLLELLFCSFPTLKIQFSHTFHREGMGGKKTSNT